MAKSKGTRQEMGDSPVIDRALAVLDTPPPNPDQRDRTWEREQRAAGKVATYRRIPPEVQAAIKNLAVELHIPVGELLGELARFALAEYQAGRLVIEAREPVRREIVRVRRANEE